MDKPTIHNQIRKVRLDATDKMIHKSIRHNSQSSEGEIINKINNMPEADVQRELKKVRLSYEATQKLFFLIIIVMYEERLKEIQAPRIAAEKKAWEEAETAAKNAEKEIEISLLRKSLEETKSLLTETIAREKAELELLQQKIASEETNAKVIQDLTERCKKLTLQRQALSDKLRSLLKNTSVNENESAIKEGIIPKNSIYNSPFPVFFAAANSGHDQHFASEKIYMHP